MAPGVAKTFIKELRKVMSIRYPECDGEKSDGSLGNDAIYEELKKIREADKNGLILNHRNEIRELIKTRYSKTLNDFEIKSLLKIALKYAEDATHQAMEAVVHNLNSMHSRAGRRYDVPELWETLGTAN